MKSPVANGKAAAITVLVGLGLIGLGFALSAPIGPTASPVYSNPKLLFAPGMVMIGIIVLFFSAVVYNVVRND